MIRRINGEHGKGTLSLVLIAVVAGILAVLFLQVKSCVQKSKMAPQGELPTEIR